jgi:uncharacterized protein (TIGR02594 family)
MMPYDVRAIQARLNDLGFGPLAVDGIQGPRTEAAIVAFKRSVGLAPRPYVGPITWSALMESAVRDDVEIPWLNEAVRMKGLHESRDKSRLRAWLEPPVDWTDPAEVPWCGAFTATVLRKWNPAVKLPENPLGARNWQTWGQSTIPQLGAVLVFWRGARTGWAGHVGFYWGEDASALHVLGGNQADSVSVTRIARDRLLAARWPEGAAQPRKIVRLSEAGRPLSTNEA